MEAVPEPPPRPRRRRVLLVLVVAAVVVTAGFVVWWEFVRPRTIAEVFAFEHFQPGMSVAVQGTITGIYRENTSYGPKVILALDHEPECNTTGQVFGDPNATYAMGQSYQTTLHFQEYTVSGNPAVFAPELACPFLTEVSAMSRVLDAVSTVWGILLVYNGSEAGGWQDYRVFTKNGDAYNLSVLPVTLESFRPIVGTTPRFPPGSTLDSAANWDSFLSALYVGAAGGGPSLYFPLVDQMPSLRSGTSANGTLRFIDANADRMLDDGDRLDIRLPPTTSAATWDTYLLQIGGPLGAAGAYVGAERVLLNGPQGLLDPLLSSEPPMVDLAYGGTQPGPPLHSTVRLASVPIGSPIPVTAIRYSLSIRTPMSFTDHTGNLTTLPATTPTRMT